MTKTIYKASSNSINDICEVNHLRSLLVSYNIECETNKLDKLKYTKT